MEILKKWARLMWAPVLVLATAAPGLAEAADAWNPQPSVDDVILPLQCDQKIVFRKIVTQEAIDQDQRSILDDRRVRLGSADIDDAYLDYLRSDFVAGSFSKDRQRFFLLGKYEITVAQYKAVTGDGCDFTADDTYMPVSRVSWFDAMDFARDFSAYILAEDKDALQEALGTNKVFARLPTETEWEFAARGGVAVSAVQFQASRFPMDTELNNYAWFNDPTSAQGEVSPVGVLEPNPLALFDIYGNVAEMMFDSFRLNKAGRAHGLAGGFTLKGGSFQSNRAYVNSSTREENSFFDGDTAAEKRDRTAGFRIAIVGPALPTGADVSRLIDEWNDASRSRLPAIEDPLELIGKLRDGLSDLELSNDLATIEQSVRAEIAQSEEDRDRLLSTILLSLGRTVDDIRTRRAAYSNRKRLKELTGDAAIFGGREGDSILDDQIAADWAAINEGSYFAQELLVHIVGTFESPTIDHQANALAAELRQQHLSDIADATLIAADVARKLSTAGQQFTREQVRDLLTTGL